MQWTVDYVDGWVLFDTSWQGLEKVEFIDTYGLVKDITVKAVPVSAAAWLFGSSLIGLAGLRRTRKLTA